MRKVAVSAPSASTPGLSLPVDYLASCLRVPVSLLLAMDQSAAEAIFPPLLARLNLTHAQDLVAQREDQRKDRHTASKIGSMHQTTAGAKSEEEQYRAVFTQLIVQQALKLGLKSVVNPALTSLVADKKLTLRILDHLVRRAYGSPPSQAPVDSGRSPAPRRTPSIDDRAPPSSSSSSSVADRRHTAGDSAVLPRRDARLVNVAATPTPSRPARAAPSPARQPVVVQRPMPSASAPPVAVEDAAAHVEEASFDDFADDDHFSPPSVAQSFDGRFADTAFDPSAAISSRRPASSQGQPRSLLRPKTKHGNSVPVSEDDMCLADLRIELAAERSRHHETALKLQTMTGMYEQLLVERGEEKFGSRRVTLLKAQNMQMERQLSLLTDGLDSRRSALSELSTIVTGLESAVGDEAPSSSTALPKSQRRLVHLEQSLEAAKQRLSKYHRCELQFSPNEEQFLQSSAPLTATSLYAGTMSHLNLDRVHMLESSLASLHETIMQTHGMLSKFAAVSPVQHQLHQFLSRSGSGGSSSSSSTLRLQSLLDNLRAASFELQSLGVLLPSHTAFSGQTNLSPSGADRDWSWIFQAQQALKKRGVPAATSDLILKRATQEETKAQLKTAMYQAELEAHRATQHLQVAALRALLRRTDDAIAQFAENNKTAYDDELQADVDAAMQEYQGRMTQLQQQQAELDHEIRQPPPQQQLEPAPARAASRASNEVSSDRQHLRSSSGRSTSRASNIGQQEPPPFQF